MSAPETTIAFTIGGAAATVCRDVYSIRRQIGARDDISIAVRDSRPTQRAQVLITLNGTLHAGGVLLERKETGPTSGLTYVSQLTVAGFEKYLDDALISEDYVAGFTLKEVLNHLTVTYLAGFGLSIDPAMAAGPILTALVFTRRKCSDIFRELTAGANWVYRVGPDKVIYAGAPGYTTAPWHINDASRAVEGDLEVTVSSLDYANHVTVVAGDPTSPIVETAENAGEIAAKGLAGITVAAPGVTDAGAAQTLAAAILAKKLPDVVTVTYDTFQHGLAPGQVQTIVRTARNLNGDFLITAVEETWPVAQVYRYRITATSLLYAVESYLDTYRAWSGGSSDAYSALIAAGPGGVTTYDLGGDQYFGVESGVPTWVAVRNSKPCSINGTTFAGRLATAKVRVRAESGGVSVTPRVRNVTTGDVAGTGALYTGTDWSPWQSIALTLAAGANLYELELLPSAANEIVFGQIYVEMQ